MPDYYMTFDVLVPKWAKWVAQDEDGSWYFYEEEPTLSERDSVWAPAMKRYEESISGSPNPNWREACYEIERK